MSDNFKFRFGMLTMGLASISASVLIPTVTIAVLASKKTSQLEEVEKPNISINQQNISGIKTIIQNFILEDSRRYTVDDIKQNYSVIKELKNILSKYLNVKVENIQYFSFNDTSLSFKLINIEKKKYSTSKDVIVQEIPNKELYSYNVTIKNLKFYKNLITESELKQLWNNVNQIIIDNKVTVAKNAADANYDQHKSKIINAINNFTFKNNEKLSNHWDQQISQDLANITFKLNPSLLPKTGLIKFGNCKFDEGYIILEDNGTVHLNFLALSSPEKYLKFKIYNSGYKSIELSEEGKRQNVEDILIPYGTKEIDWIGLSDFFPDPTSWKLKNIILPDTMIQKEQPSIFRGSMQELYIKLSRNFKRISSWLDKSTKMKIDMFEGIEEIVPHNFSNILYNKNVILPRSVKKLGYKSFQFDDKDNKGFEPNIISFKTWAENLPYEFLSNQSKLETIYLMADKIEVENIDFASFINIPSTTKIYVKNESVRNNIVDVVSKYTGKEPNISESQIIVDPDLV